MRTIKEKLSIIVIVATLLRYSFNFECVRQPLQLKPLKPDAATLHGIKVQKAT